MFDLQLCILLDLSEWADYIWILVWGVENTYEVSGIINTNNRKLLEY